MPELPPVTSTFLPRSPGSPTVRASAAVIVSAMRFSSESGFAVQSPADAGRYTAIAGTSAAGEHGCRAFVEELGRPELHRRRCEPVEARARQRRVEPDERPEEGHDGE